jgi:hypothetical protein
MTVISMSFVSALSSTPKHVNAETVNVLFGTADIPVPTTTTTTTAPPVTEPPTTVPPEVLTVPTASLEDISTYIMRTLPPEQLIRYMWRNTPDVDLMLRIAAREACLYCKHRDGTPYTAAEICSADNPYSSAAGLFQTMGFHKTLAESMGLSWANITGPDCWDDARLAFQLYNHGKGLRNWSPLP